MRGLFICFTELIYIGVVLKHLLVRYQQHVKVVCGDLMTAGKSLAAESGAGVAANIHLSSMGSYGTWCRDVDGVLTTCEYDELVFKRSCHFHCSSSSFYSWCLLNR